MGVSYLGTAADRFSGALNTSIKLPGTIWIEIDKYRELEKKYDVAIQKLEEYRLDQDRFDRLRNENDSLRKELGFPSHPELPELKAEVLGVRINSISPRIIINRGSKDGVQPFMPVIYRSENKENQLVRAVAGIVASVHGTTSVVQPINHPNFQMGVKVPSGGQWAILNGNSGKLSEVLLSYLAQDGSPDRATYSDTNIAIGKGALVVTSGSAGIFPPGIPVGYITREGQRDGEFKTAYVKTIANIGRMDYVSILMKSPEPWAENINRDLNWDEHLMTEFGPPVFPQTEQSKPEKKVRTAPETRKVESRTGSATTTEKPEPATPQSENTNPTDRKPENQTPRRLNNLNR